MSNNYRKPFTLSCHKNGKSYVWYYGVYIEDVRIFKSTGIGFTNAKDKAKTRRQADAYCAELLRQDLLVPNLAPTLSAWVDSMRFWDWAGSKYVRQILARSGKDRPGITESYVLKADQITRDHILPHHGDKPIDQITPYDCEQLLFLWAEKVSAKTANNRKSVYSTILGEYEREQKMRNPAAVYFNPWKIVRPLRPDRNRYGAFTIGEAKRILLTDGLDLTDYRTRLYYTAVKLAFLTGLRVNEVCGLYTDDIIDQEFPGEDRTKIRLSYIQVSRQWHDKLQRRTPVKDKETRMIPIAAELREELEPYLTGPGRYVFSFHPRQEAHLPDNRLRLWFYERMEQVGISAEERVSRKLAFHSTRRFFNTLLRTANVADSVIQRFTGHDSTAMTEHYTDYLPEDLRMISDAQSRLLTEK